MLNDASEIANTANTFFTKLLHILIVNKTPFICGLLENWSLYFIKLPRLGNIDLDREDQDTSSEHDVSYKKEYLTRDHLL